MGRLFGSLKFKIIFISMVGVVGVLLTVFGYVLPLYRETVLESLKGQVRSSVDVAYTTIEHFERQAQEKLISEDQAKGLAKEAVRAMRFNTTDYFFIYDLNGVGVMHPLNPESEGKNHTDRTDPNGVPFVKNLIALAASPEGSGFTEYSYPKVKGGDPIGKISYVRGFKPWNWFVGSGVYKDVVDQQIREFENRIYTVFAVIAVLISLLSLRFGVSLSKRIDNVVSIISTSSAEISRTIESISEAGKHLAEASTSAAASLEETVASLEQVTSVVQMNSGNAKQASDLSQTSRDTAQVGEQHIGDLVGSMKQISDDSKKISEIINVIDDIAFQTNLLALNAAVEAARAGEQGKGFAVVAEAVRSLAQRSAIAAKDIDVMIKENVDKVETGRSVADRSGEVLGSIVLSVKKVADLNGEIAAASTEQTTGIQQINKAMNQLDQVIQANAASTEEISASVNEISNRMKSVENEATALRRLVQGG